MLCIYSIGVCEEVIGDQTLMACPAQMCTHSEWDTLHVGGVWSIHACCLTH